jgi:DNA topoisomerase-1
VGKHPSDGEPIVASPGRFGPYIKHGKEFRSLENEERLFTVSLDEAVALLAEPKKSRRRQSAAKTVLRELGPHPKGGAPVNVLAGRYGPYVTDGTTNASLPKGMTPEAVTMEQAAELLAARAGAPKRGRCTASPGWRPQLAQGNDECPVATCGGGPSGPRETQRRDAGLKPRRH